MLPRTRSNKFNFKKFECPAYILSALDLLRPPEDITVSEWAERYRLLDSRSSAMAGRWNNDVTPYLRGVMDAFSDWSIEKIVFCKPTQVGGTEALMNMLAYTVAQDPAPCLLVEPSEQMGESFSDNRLQPMFEKCPELKKHYNARASQKLELQFDGMYITITGSNSPASLASRPIRVLCLDEVDKYTGATSKEADPINLAIERTKTFNNRKIYLTSTPTTDKGHIWRHLQACDVEKHYFVPCPHCGEMIELKFEHLHIPDDPDLSDIDRAARASYVCQECGAVITDADKVKILKRGEWQEVRRSGKLSRSVGFWISTLYSPFTRFEDIAKNYLLSKGDRDAEHNFQNSWLAIPYEEKGEELESDQIRNKQTEIPEFVIPEWCKLLAAGVDVQKDCLYYVILAGGINYTMQVITCGQVASFSDIERVMNAFYRFEDGTQKQIDLCLVDSGNDTDRVYDFCLNNQEWAMAVKGSSTPMLSHYKISRVNKQGSGAQGLPLVIVDGAKYKDMIFSRLKRADPSGSFRVYQGISPEYCEQMVAEHKVAETKNGVTVYKWKPRKSHAQNHMLDCTVYATAALDLLNIRSLYSQENEQAHEIVQNRGNYSAISELDADPNVEPTQTPEPQDDYSEFGNDWLSGGW